MRDGIDEYTLLCEDCGYVIEGLPREGQCPECGKAVAESLPERRVGLPWQNEPSGSAFLNTARMVLLHPRQTLSRIVIDEEQATEFRRLTTSIAGMQIATPVVMLWLAWDYQVRTILLSPIAFFIVFFAVRSILMVLTRIERRGLTIIGRSRGWRVDTAIAGTVTSYGTAAWVFAAFGPCLLMIVAVPIVLFDMSPTVHGNGTSHVYTSPSFSSFGWAVLQIIFYGIGITPLIGFLLFETFAYLGLRRCRFANRHRPDPGLDSDTIGTVEVEEETEARR